MQKRNRAARRAIKTLRERRSRQIVPVAVQQTLHEEVAAHESVSGEALARFTEHRCDRHIVFHLRHMTLLTAHRVFVFAVQPFLIGNLLGQGANHLALSIECLGEKGVAGGAHLRRTDHLFGLGRLECGRRPHDRRVPLVDLKRAVLLALAWGLGAVNLEPANKTLAPAQIFAADLVA